jgi:hypothetical protein
VQKVHRDNPRGDFITRVDFTKPGDLTSLAKNWGAVNAPFKSRKDHDKAGNKSFKYKLLPHVYYSVVETHSHYFVLYAVYHPQDWEDGSSGWRPGGPKWTLAGSEHQHDMEGALVIAGKRTGRYDFRPDAMITISHWWFYSYANWRYMRTDNKDAAVFDESYENRYRGSRVNKETLDGYLWANWHYDEEKQTTMRPKIYVQAKGHGIRGDRKDWGGEKRAIRYCPSLKKADEPAFEESVVDNGIRLCWRKPKDKDPNKDPNAVISGEAYRYKLIDIFSPKESASGPLGLWSSRDNPAVFQVDKKGQDSFAIHETNKRPKPGSAKPPWSWDDRDDARPTGELALQPAHIVYGYLGGIREFSLEYLRNPYLGI